MDRRNEHGVALVITLFLMAALSALAVSLMFLSQTETSASRNYKTMSQARYAGEAGVHKAMNYLMSDAYTTTLAGTYGSLTTGVYPVQWNGADVVLNPSTGTPAYPNSTVRAAYLAMFSGTANDLPAGTANLKYTATAKLLSMQPVNVYGSNTKYIQTWQITSTGTVQGPLPATVDVTASSNATSRRRRRMRSSRRATAAGRSTFPAPRTPTATIRDPWPAVLRPR